MKPTIILIIFLTAALSAFGDVAKQWIHALEGRHATIEEKAKACQRLGEFGDESAIPALAAVLNDPVLNTYACTALERIPGKKGRAALRAALQTCEGLQLVGVVESLGTLDVTEAAADLRKLIGHADNRVSDAALRTLGRMSGKTPRIVLEYLKDSSADVRASAATAALLSAEGRGDSIIYEAVLKAAVPKQIHLAAIRGAILSKQSIPFLLDQLRSEDPDVQDVAFTTLRSFSKNGLTEALHKELNTAGGANPVRVVQALRDRPNKVTAGVLIGKLRGAEGNLQLAIIQALGRLGGSESATALLPLLPLEQAAAALIEMEGDGIDELLVASLKTEKQSVRRIGLIELLGNRHAKEAVDILLVQARDPDFEIAKAALRALRPMSGVSQVSGLIALFKDSNEKTSSLAFNALAGACQQSIPPKPAGDQILAELKKAKGGEDREPWKRILVAMGHTPALAVIAKELDSNDAKTVQDTISLLGRWPNPAPVDALFKVAENAHYQTPALRSILSLLASAKDMEARLSWLKQAQPMVSSPAEKRQFVSLLSSTFLPGSLDLLQPYLKDADVEEEASDARSSLVRLMRL